MFPYTSAPLSDALRALLLVCVAATFWNLHIWKSQLHEYECLLGQHGDGAFTLYQHHGGPIDTGLANWDARPLRPKLFHAT